MFYICQTTNTKTMSYNLEVEIEGMNNIRIEPVVTAGILNVWLFLEVYGHNLGRLTISRLVNNEFVVPTNQDEYLKLTVMEKRGHLLLDVTWHNGDPGLRHIHREPVTHLSYTSRIMIKGNETYWIGADDARPQPTSLVRSIIPFTELYLHYTSNADPATGTLIIQSDGLLPITPPQGITMGDLGIKI